MRNNRGFAPILILLVIGLVLVGLALFSLREKINFSLKPNSSPPPRNEATAATDYRVTKKDPKDPRYNLLRTKYHMTNAQIEALTTASDTDR